MESTGQNVSGHTPPEGSEKKTNEELTQQLTENQDPFSLNAIVNDAIIQHWSNRLWFCQSDDEVLKTLQHSKGLRLHKRHSGEIKAAIAQQKIDKPPAVDEHFSLSDTAKEFTHDFFDQSVYLRMKTIYVYGRRICIGKTLAGNRCKNVITHEKEGYCQKHKHQAPPPKTTAINPRPEVVELYFDQEERPLKKSKQTINNMYTPN